MYDIDKAITDVANILDHLIAYRNVMRSGSCNDCLQQNNHCPYAPKIGEQVRYNCPFYGMKEETE